MDENGILPGVYSSFRSLSQALGVLQFLHGGFGITLASAEAQLNPGSADAAIVALLSLGLLLLGIGLWRRSRTALAIAFLLHYPLAILGIALALGWLEEGDMALHILCPTGASVITITLGHVAWSLGNRITRSGYDLRYGTPIR